MIRSHCQCVGNIGGLCECVGTDGGQCECVGTNDGICERAGTNDGHIVQELCESRGGRPGLSVLTSLLVSVDVKIY